MQVKLLNNSLLISGPAADMMISYPDHVNALTAYSFVWECCTRFSKEAELTSSEDEPKIYVYGEVYRWSQFLHKLGAMAKKAGAAVSVSSEGTN